VTVKPYGTRPNRLSISTNMKIENTNGKKRIPSSPAELRTVEAMNS
jgi:hypothetical protein